MLDFSFLSSSIVVLALIITLPFPVLYNSSIPCELIIPPVGKSGPLTISAKSSTLISGLFM